MSAEKPAKRVKRAKRDKGADQMMMSVATAQAPSAPVRVGLDPEHVRSALRSTLGIFRAVWYPSADGVSDVPDNVCRFLSGIRMMVGATSLKEYYGAAGRFEPGKGREEVRKRLEGLMAMCLESTSPSSRLADGYAEAVAALDAMEIITKGMT